MGAKRNNDWLRNALGKAFANPEYYLSILFTWGHRAAILLLPIVGLTLAAVYISPSGAISSTTTCWWR